MASYEVTIKRFNGTGWDSYYPTTTIEQVKNLSSTLANMQTEIDDALTSVAWNDITGKPSWIGSSKPSYSWSEITSKPSWIGSSKPTYSWSEISSKPSWIGSSKPSYSWDEITSRPSAWMLFDNSSTSISKTSYVNTSLRNLSDGDVVALEVCYGSSASGYTHQIVTVAVGSDTTTSASKTHPRMVGISDFDGTYFKAINFKAYLYSGTLRLGYLRTLVGEFSGSTINWTTDDSITVYVKRIWKLV